MRVLAHVSDLHFGRLEPAALEPLRRGLRRLAPDLLLVSGDLTQRARRGQFRDARAFLDTLPGPQIVVPGNHDVPLYNLLARFLQPFGGYRRAIGRELEPGYADDEIAVIGVNTAHGFTFKKGRVSDAQLARLRARLDALSGARLRILVMHHFCPELCALGVDIIVAGHAHASRVGASSSLVVHAGTATSSRTRAEPNSFNVLRVTRGRVTVEHYLLRDGAFARAKVASFRHDGARWRREPTSGARSAPRGSAGSA